MLYGYCSLCVKYQPTSSRHFAALGQYNLKIYYRLVVFQLVFVYSDMIWAPVESRIYYCELFFVLYSSISQWNVLLCLLPIKILLIISLFLFFLFLNFIFTAGPLTQPATSCHGIRGVVERFIESWNGECTFLTSILKFVLLSLCF